MRLNAATPCLLTVFANHFCLVKDSSGIHHALGRAIGLIRRGASGSMGKGWRTFGADNEHFGFHLQECFNAC